MNLYLNHASSQIRNQQTRKPPEYQAPLKTCHFRI